MRFTLTEMAFMCIVCSAVAIPFALFLERFVESELLIFVIAFTASIPVYLVISSALYRRFHVLPMMKPFCPKCKGGYYAPLTPDTQESPINDQWEGKVEARCMNCGTEIEAWFKVPNLGAISKSKPSFLLVWPYSIGRWKRINPD